MKTNLFTIVISNSNSIRKIPGWYVSTCGNEDGFLIHELGKIKSKYVSHLRDGMDWLLAASFRQKTVKEVIDDDDYSLEKEFERTELELISEPDDNFYFRIFLPKDMRLSENFEVLFDELVEDPLVDGTYQRTVIAKASCDNPLSIKTFLCI